MRITEDWLQQYPDLQAVCSMNDSMILGTIEAEKAAGRTLFTYGVDGMAEGCNAVKEGYLSATALQDARELAKGGLELAARVIAGEELTGEDVVHVDAALITPDNVDEFLAIHEGGEE
jgi:ABC-type sugar transport system substrate-binding protein